MVISKAYLEQILDSFVLNWNKDPKSGKLSIVKKETKFDCIFAILHLKKRKLSYSKIIIFEGSMTSVPYNEICWNNGHVNKSKKVTAFKRIERQHVYYVTSDGREHKMRY